MSSYKRNSGFVIARNLSWQIQRHDAVSVLIYCKRSLILELCGHPHSQLLVTYLFKRLHLNLLEPLRF